MAQQQGLPPPPPIQPLPAPPPQPAQALGAVGGAPPVQAVVGVAGAPARPPWYDHYPHMPMYYSPKAHKKVSSPKAMPPGIFAYWSTRNNETRLALKVFDYDVTPEKTFKFDHQGLAETKPTFNGIEIKPEDAIRAIRVWSAMLEHEGYDLESGKD